MSVGTLTADPLVAKLAYLPFLPALLAVRLILAANVATGPKILQFPSPAALLATEGFSGCMFLIYRRSLPFQCELSCIGLALLSR